MNLFKTKYRIVKTEYGRYWPQFRYWWVPWWSECFTRQDSAGTYDDAVQVCRNHMYKRYVTEHMQ